MLGVRFRLAAALAVHLRSFWRGKGRFPVAFTPSPGAAAAVPARGPHTLRVHQAAPHNSCAGAVQGCAAGGAPNALARDGGSAEGGGRRTAGIGKKKDGGAGDL